MQKSPTKMTSIFLNPRTHALKLETEPSSIVPQAPPPTKKTYIEFDIT